MEIIRWLAQYGQTALESLGIIGSLTFNAVSLRNETKARRVGNLLAISDQYRSIWEELYDRPELLRVLDAKVNLKLKPLTDQERIFVQFLIIYLGTVYRAIKEDDLLRPHGMDRDMREFFALPIPRAIWKNLREYQDRDFVTWVDSR